MTAEYRLAFATITKAALEADSSFLLENWPLQTDQYSKNLYPWGPPSDNGTTYPRYAKYVPLLDQTIRPDGFIQFNWSLPYLTEGMVDYLENGTATIYDNPTFDGYSSRAVTVKTLCKDGIFRVYHAVAWAASEEGTDFIRGFQGVENYILKFRKGVVVTS